MHRLHVFPPRLSEYEYQESLGLGKIKCHRVTDLSNKQGHKAPQKGILAGEKKAELFCKRDNSLLIRRINLLEQRLAQRFTQNVWNASYRTISSCLCTSYSEIVLTSWNYFLGREWSVVCINVYVDRVINGLIISELSLVFFLL